MTTNQDPADFYTWLHFAAGAAMSVLDFKPLTVFAITFVYEGVEQGIIANIGQQLPPSPAKDMISKESPINIAVDIFAVFAGYALIEVIKSP